jgi:uncharacterized protein
VGTRHQLNWLRGEFGDAVVMIGRPAYTAAGFTAAAATQRAIVSGAPVVYQATMFDGRFIGFADFLICDGPHYRVSDTKLARSAKVTALLQLAAYADTLSRAGVPAAPEAERQSLDVAIPMRTNRSMSQARVIPELVYPDVPEAVTWLCAT